MPDTLQLEIVAADRLVWSGEAHQISARTVDGELGVLAHHTPLLGVLAPGAVEVRTSDDGYLVAAIDGGFISVAANRVSVLAEHVELVDDINVEQARRDLADAERAGEGDPAAAHRATFAQARITAVEMVR